MPIAAPWAMRSRTLALPLVLAPVVLACEPPPAQHAVLYPLVHREAADDESLSSQAIEIDYDAADTPTPMRLAAMIPASELDRPHPDPVFFALGAGHGALGQIDVDGCGERGIPVGYLRMRATFRPSGHISRAVVMTESPPTQEALDCIAEKLRVLRVPAFDGENVTLSREYFVEHTGAGWDVVVSQ
jgi:hypothetical protein